jgi:hypothetical protein
LNLRLVADGRGATCVPVRMFPRQACRAVPGCRGHPEPPLERCSRTPNPSFLTCGFVPSPSPLILPIPLYKRGGAGCGLGKDSYTETIGSLWLKHESNSAVDTEKVRSELDQVFSHLWLLFLHLHLQLCRYPAYKLTVLVPRQKMTGADRQWATQYEPDDIVRYTRGSQAVGVESDPLS